MQSSDATPMGLYENTLRIFLFLKKNTLLESQAFECFSKQRYQT